MTKNTKVKSLVTSWWVAKEEVLYLRTSLLKTYLKCPAQCMFRYFKGLVVAPKSALTVGGTFHKTAENHFVYKKKKGKNQKLSTLQDVFNEEFKSRKLRTNWSKDEKPDKILDHCVGKIIPAYYKERAVKIIPKEVEIDFKMFIPEVNAYLTGQIDLIEMSNVIRDHKTTARTPNWLRVVKSFQRRAYGLGYQHVYNKLPKGFLLDYIIKGKNYDKALIESSKLIIPQEHEMVETLEMIKRIIISIRKGCFYPNEEGNMFCTPNGCGYWNICHKGAWKTPIPFTKIYGGNEAVDEEEDD